jgi:Fur family peroxide stress response transcriptional regulator
MAVSRDELQRRLESFLGLCRRRGFKATPQRLEIFRQVAQTEEHPNADVIYERVRKRMPTVSVDTVYRTLAFLEENALILKVSRLAGSARFDANVRKHHHFVCTQCGGIWDFYSEELDSFQAPPEVAALGDVASVHAELHGICSACQGARTDAETMTGNGGVP